MSHFKRFFTLSLVCLTTTIFTMSAQALIRLEAGSYANRTLIDTARREANLSFTYYGCAKNPDASKIKLTTDGNCKLARNYNLGQSQNKTAISGTVGEINAYYEGDSEECENKVSKRLHSTISLNDLYEEFQKNSCFPTHIVLQDSDESSARRIWQTRENKRLCSMPDTRVTKQNFPTDDVPFFNLKANDSGFKVGDHSSYRYDHNKRQWCVKFRENSEICGQWPNPLIMAYRSKTDKKIHVKGTISLDPSGKASIRAIDKSYNSDGALSAAQKNGEFLRSDKSKGRIDYQTWRKSNGVVRALARSYETDTPNAHHQRTLNFFARNVFGVGITNSWCKDEHCLLGVEDEKLVANKCNANPKVELTNGGNGNTCHSCIGVTPGLCAVTKEQVDLVKSKIIENEHFSLQPTGEYKFGQDVEKGLLANYTQIIEKPKNPGCHRGYAPGYENSFDAGAGEGSRSVNSADKSL